MCVYILLAVNTGRASTFGRSKEIAKITSKKCYVSSETSLLIANIACVRMWMISFYQKIFSPILIKPLLAYFLFYFWKKTSRKTKLSLILVPIPDFEKQFLFHSVSCILWAWQQTFSGHQFHLWWLFACLCFPLSHPIWWLVFSHCSYPPLLTILKIHKESLNKYVRKIFRKTNISNPWMHTPVSISGG